MNHGRKGISLFLALALALTLAAGAPSAARADELTPIIFCLDWTPNTNHTGV